MQRGYGCHKMADRCIQSADLTFRLMPATEAIIYWTMPARWWLQAQSPELVPVRAQARWCSK